MQRTRRSTNQVAQTAALMFFIGLLLADGLVAFFLIRERLSIYFPRKPVVYLPVVSKDSPLGDPTAVPPTATPGPAATATPASAQKFYVVQSGDTLWQIAQDHGVSVDDIVTANKLEDRNFIEVGQELIIPPPGD